MKITCTLSEYTKVARQCGENKARFNCRNCPLNGVIELEEGQSCDIELFVQAITQGQETTRRRALAEPTMLNNHAAIATEVPEGCVHAIVPRAGGRSSETR